MLLINKQYEDALVQIQSLLALDKYNRMKGSIFLGMYHEKHLYDPEKARILYEKGLELSGDFGDRANYSKAYAYMGLSRYYSGNDDIKKAKEFRRKACASTGYEYVLVDENTIP